MLTITEKEVRRIVSIHFKEKYNQDVSPDEMEWEHEHFPKGRTVKSLKVKAQDSETTFDSESGVTICNNCGAHDADNPGHDITHYPTCRKGESKKWESLYSKEGGDP